MVVFGQSGCIRAKVVVFGQKWLYLDKLVVFEQKLMFSGPMVVLRQKWLYSDNSGCIPENCSKWAKVVVFGQSDF